LILVGLIDLHPLALEDVFHGHSQNRSKADYYTKHLFLRVLCHELVGDNFQPTQITNIPRSDSPEPMANDIEREDGYQLEESANFTKIGGSLKSGGSLSKRRPFGGTLLPTSRTDIEPIYPGNQEKMGVKLKKLISDQSAVGIINPRVSSFFPLRLCSR